MQNFALVILFVATTACAKHNYQTPAPVDAKASTACAHILQKSEACFDLQWKELPKQRVYTSFTINIKSLTTGNAVDLPGDLQVHLWMPSMGHGSSPVTVSRTGTGQYLIDQVYFVMGGKWQIVFQVKKGNVIDQYALPIDIQ